MWAATQGDFSKLQGDLNFAFDQRESKVNLHKATSLPESPSNVSPDAGDRIDGIMVSVPALSVVDRGFEPRSGPTKDYKIGLCCFSANHTALRDGAKTD